VTSDEQKDNAPCSCLPRARGFSLLEMMMVITLILILATISTPYYQTAIVRTREAVLRDDLFTLRSQIDRFTADNKRAPASLEELVEKAYMGSIPRGPFTGSTETWTVEMEDASLALDDSQAAEKLPARPIVAPASCRPLLKLKEWPAGSLRYASAPRGFSQPVPPRRGSWTSTAGPKGRRWKARRTAVGREEQGTVASGERQIQNLKFKRKAAAMPINHNKIIEEQ
jgi:prepilin-type N-terminal cleavage/methylation domain-containing protein